MSGNRDLFFDIVKGVAIFIVVLGHVIQTFSADFRSDHLEQAIIMMHMPLFMMVSGYFFYPSVKKKPITAFIKAKFIRLYLPSLFWGAFGCLLIGGGKVVDTQRVTI